MAHVVIYKIYYIGQKVVTPSKFELCMMCHVNVFIKNDPCANLVSIYTNVTFLDLGILTSP